MKNLYGRSGVLGLFAVVLSVAALASFAFAKGGHGGGGHHGGGHHGGGHHGGGHHGSHHSSHHHSSHHHSGHHDGHHDGHHVHHHVHHHHYYHGGGGWGYGGWGWGGGLWGVPAGYAADAAYAVPYGGGDSIQNNYNDDDSENNADDGDDDSDDEDSDDGDDDSQDGDDQQDNADGKTSANAAPTRDRGALHIKLPTKDATVLFDGQKMIGMGIERWVLTPVIANGETAKYQVQALWTEDGKEVHQVREGTISAGQKATLDFTTPDSNAVTSPTTARSWQTLILPAVSAVMGTGSPRQ